MRLIILSDTHGLHDAIGTVPDGDVLIHAGDMTGRGTLEELAVFLAWFQAQPHRAKLLIAGNHDWAFERQAAVAEALVPQGITYLRDAGVSLHGVTFWGSPWQPWFFDWAFNLHRGAEIAAKWALIPDDVKVLITHGPPHGILDAVMRPPGKHEGCEALRERLGALPQLQVHAFGHIHEAYGTIEDEGRRFVNASICNVSYAPVNAPVIVDL
ncbi:MAG: metallophosphatase domain-containing protein [Gemmatimonadetes bacterium]|nr:metallophosphatase domain-containing protein [Gemmatimonadota bacterium]